MKVSNLSEHVEFRHNLFPSEVELAIYETFIEIDREFLVSNLIGSWRDFFSIRDFLGHLSAQKDVRRNDGIRSLYNWLTTDCV